MSQILVVDDDDSLRRVIEFQLSQAGYRVATAEDGHRGLELFRQLQPTLVISDVQMPGISGDDLLAAIRAEAPETMVIMVTAFGTVEKAVEAMRAGAHDYLTKPFSRDALLLCVERALTFRGLEKDNRRLREELRGQQALDSLIGVSESMQEVKRMISRVAASEASVLLLGESGTGKELVARAIHQGSGRAHEPFIPVNCAAIPSELLESELFGHLKGAFTGAVKDRQGKFIQADGGTIFLDEVGDLPLDLQPKLLRVLQEMEVEPVGGVARKIDVRVIAATNLDLQTAIAEGRFREDLYYRLAVIPIQLPALRRRPEDIALLARHFVARYAGGQEVDIDPEVLDRFRAYRWPGNVRELENSIERMLVLRRGESLGVDDLPPAILHPDSPVSGNVLQLPEEGYPLEQLEKEAVMLALERCGGNQSRAARFLSIPRHVLLYRMEKFGIK
ncbi:DNA-binding response regulator [Geothermobacter hydrogeniphilus]|uniref:DNA-binding response regulator n=2 Tax=Geothermobacter hydrogeniphilus TaxID=1969733 RepID=A0A1X0Y3B9_9BACT|nr:sigma-54 dependent transcriptional regulator [Geothermobacter hydrogeniphilus]ORJ59564.1 DNA-binding response regulator [Geothermobacter hydrogeniphilus]